MVGAILAGLYGFVAFLLMNAAALILTALSQHWSFTPDVLAAGVDAGRDFFPPTCRYVDVCLGNQVAKVLAGSLASVIGDLHARDKG